MSTRAWTQDDVAGVLRRPTASDDKYSRGVIGIRTGSARYPGAAVLGVEAAWRTGVGMVRYVGDAEPARLVLQRRPETVTGEGRVQAWLIGSGTDAAERGAREAAALRRLLAGDVPVVADAGALDLVAEASAPLVVTPHAGEHARLRAALGLPEAGEDPADVVATAAALGAVVVRKGARTVVAAPGEEAIVCEAPTAWLATAGTGDVLAGIIGALVAGADRSDLAGLQAVAASGVWLHGRAAALAVAAHDGGPITAGDVAAHVPRAVGDVLAGA